MVSKEVVGDISWKNNIQKLVKWLEVFKAKGITDQTCHIFYLDLEKLYMHTSTHIPHLKFRCDMGSNKQQFGAQVLARWGSYDVYNTIPKFQKWLIMSYVVNVARVALLAFYIFRNEKMWEDYLKVCKPWTYMAM